jgi:hypothetical protein
MIGFSILRMAVQFAFIYARPEGSVRTLAGKRHYVGGEELFTESVKSALLSCIVAPTTLTLQDPSKDWATGYKAVHNRILGMVVLRPSWRADALSFLSREIVIQRDFWTKLDSKSDCIMIDVVEVAPVREQVLVSQHLAGARHHSTVFRLSNPSMQLLSNSIDEYTGRPLLETLARWRVQYPMAEQQQQRQPELWHGFSFNIAMSLPAPFAVLCAVGAWKSFVLPFALGRRGGGLGWNLVPSLTSGLARLAGPVAGNDGDDDHGAPSLSPDLLLSCAQFLQKHREALSDDIGDLTFHVSWMLQLRDSMLHDSQLSGRRAYRMNHLINSLALAGYARDSHDLRDLCVQAINTVVREAQLRSYFQNMLTNTAHIIPSSTTLYRHRLTMHMGFSLYMGKQMQNMMESPGGMCCWQTVDSSPHMNFDWVLTGMATMRTCDLQESFQHAMILLSSDPEEVRPEVRDAARHLALKLALVPGVPTAVASGKAGLAAKMHATIHSRRLTSMSWKGAVRTMNSTASWVGDLGTEARFCRFRGHIKDMFGQWAVDADQQGRDEDVQDDAGVSDEFDFAAPDAVAAVPPQDDAVAEGAADISDYPMPADEHEVDCTASVYIAGVMHIVSNLTVGFSGCLEHFGDFLLELTMVCRLLSRKWSRPNATGHRTTMASLPMSSPGDGEACSTVSVNCCP